MIALLKRWLAAYQERTWKLEQALQEQCRERDRQAQEYLIWRGIVL